MELVIGGLALIVGFALTHMLLVHQRKMAELRLRLQRQEQTERDLELLRLQVRDLKDVLYHHTVALDSAVRALRIPPEEANRLER